jgi:hypothetical protein
MQIAPEQSHQQRYLAGRPAPVVSAERIECQRSNSAVGRRLDDLAHLSSAGNVTRRAKLPPCSRPSAIAIHDYRDVNAARRVRAHDFVYVLF